MEAENKARLQELLANIEAFIGQPAHVTYVGGTKRQLADVEENLLEIDPLDAQLATKFAYLQGQRLVLTGNVTLFEDTVDNLKARIEAILDEENQIPLDNEPNEI